MQQIHHVELMQTLLVNQKEIKCLRNMGQGSNVLLSWVQLFTRCCVLNTKWAKDQQWILLELSREELGVSEQTPGNIQLSWGIGRPETLVSWHQGAFPLVGKWGHFPSLNGFSERSSPAHQEQRVGAIYPSRHCSAMSLLTCPPAGCPG